MRENPDVFGAVSPHDGTLDTLILPEVNPAALSLFLAEVASPPPHEALLLVLDGAGWQRARQLIIPENIHVLPLPPYRPQLNPLEHIWEEVREKWFPHLVFDTLAAVEDRRLEALLALESNPQLVASTTGFDWLLSIPMNATWYQTCPRLLTSWQR